MLLAYEPRNVRDAQLRSAKIYGAIRMAKRMGADDERIRKEIADEYDITPTYAQNYIETVEKEGEDEKDKHEKLDRIAKQLSGELQSLPV